MYQCVKGEQQKATTRNRPTILDTKKATGK